MTRRRPSQPRLSIRLEAVPEAAPAARRALTEFEGELSPDALNTISLLVSELVTNAIRHARRGPEDIVLLEVELLPASVRVEVTDEGAGFEPAIPDGDPARASGWGLYLVETLSQRWGVDRGDCTRVWFEIERGPRPEGISA